MSRYHSLDLLKELEADTLANLVVQCFKSIREDRLHRAWVIRSNFDQDCPDFETYAYGIEQQLFTEEEKDEMRLKAKAVKYND